jgi:RNA polymerase sigma-70 factor (ECF subfamily)
MTTGGPPEWLRGTIDRHSPALTAYALRLCGGDAERARDAVQETFLRLMRDPPDAAAGLNGQLTVWLYAVCRSRVTDARRKERRMTLMTDEAAAALTDPAALPDAAVATTDAADRVLAVLATLPPPQQEVVRLKFQHGLTYREIAQATGHSEGNVGFLIHVALKTLRARVRE